MSIASVALALAVLTSPFRPDPADGEATAVQAAAAPGSVCSPDRIATARKAEAAARSGKAVAGLPESYGKSFRTLDAYLAHLECHAAPVDAAWWLEVEPGVYRHMTTATNAKPEIATRAQLMRRYGFSR